MRNLLAVSSIVLLTSILASAPAPQPRPNLLKNSSFEEGPNVGNYQAFAQGNKDIPGWVVTRGGIDVVDSYWQASQGKRTIDLHGSPGLGGIQQTFATKPGRTYKVTFSLAANPDGSFPKKSMAVAAAGKSMEFSCDATGKTRDNMGWQKKSWKFVAADKETTLELFTTSQNDESCGPVIDDVQVMEDDGR